MNSIQKLLEAVVTNVAATLVNRKPQPLRTWACLENGPIRAVRINGRLDRPVDEIAALLNEGATRPIIGGVQ